ncbi:hypothetical protein AB205_0120240, partial [Aquarana catesbeiana]
FPKPYGFAVDVGCGTGQNTRTLSPYFKKVLGIDISEAQIEEAKKATGSPNVTYRSACYFCAEQHKPLHILLALDQVAHPHTAQSIKSCVEKCLKEWDIPKRKIVTVLTDNGSNLVAAFKQTAAAEEQPSSSEEDSPMTESDSDFKIDDLRYQQIDIDQKPCVVHTLQLVVQMVQKEAGVKGILDKTRSIVDLFRKSIIATQATGALWPYSFKLLPHTLIKYIQHDCKTESVCQIANNMGWDSLLPSEWQKLTSLHDLVLLLQNLSKPSRVTPCPCPL